MAYLENDCKIDEPKAVNPCLKAAMLNGNLSTWKDLEGPAFLASVVARGSCPCCGEDLICTVQDILEQGIAGYDYEDGGRGGALKCADCDVGLYVTNLCSGNPGLDGGKGHNHCPYCPDWGQCIGDIRNAHCHRCGDHYFQGYHGFKCPSCTGNTDCDAESSDDDDDDDSDDIPSSDDDDEETTTTTKKNNHQPGPIEKKKTGPFLACLPEVERQEHLDEAQELLGPEGLLTKFSGAFPNIPTLETMATLSLAEIRTHLQTMRKVTRMFEMMAAEGHEEGEDDEEYDEDEGEDEEYDEGEDEECDERRRRRRRRRRYNDGP